ncbi:unnamed protein product, partial [Meganyctiphanes norvegica]
MDSPVFEKVLAEVGNSGRHQSLLFWMFVVPINFLIPWIPLTPIFMTSTPTHTCRVPGHPSNISEDVWKQLTIPREEDGTYNQCQQYNITGDNIKDLDLHGNISSIVSLINYTYGIVDCRSDWDYDLSTYDSTLSMDQNWVCSRDSIGATWQAVGMAGNILGTLIFNSLSDFIGRRPVFVLTILIYTIFGIARLYMTSFMGIMVMQFISSMPFPAILEITLIIAMEQASPQWRSRITASSFIFWTAGMSLLPLVAWLSRSWQTLGLITTLPFAIFLLAWRYLPESPRFLLSRGRLEETHKLLSDIAKRNGQPVPDKLEITLLNLAQENVQESNYGIIQLFQNRTMFIRTFLLTVCYTCNNLFYYGLAYNTTNMSGNEFLNFFLLSIMELPSNLLGWLSAEWIGRRWTQCGCFTLATIFALASVGVSDGPVWVSITLLSISKLFITMSFLVIYLQCAEIYPTTHRAAGTGFSSIISSCFGTTAPYIAYTATKGAWIPNIILAIIGAIGICGACFLPETLGETLPESITDAKKFLVNEKFFSYKGKSCTHSKVHPVNDNQNHRINAPISENVPDYDSMAT